jgi:hypothetical protein
VAKPEAFVKWSRAVFRAVKGGLSFDRTLPLPAYVGPAARSWLDEHKPSVALTGTMTIDG